MKTFLCTLLFFALGLNSVKAQQQPIEVKGLAAKDYYVSPMPNGISCPQYSIWFEIKNITNQNLVFDTVKVFWQCRGGTFQQITVSSVEGGDSDPFNPKIKDFVITSGEAHGFEFDTDGYTRDLLQNKGDQPIYFIFVLVKRDKLTAGPFMAELPELKALPDLHYHSIDPKDNTLFKLTFKVGVPKY